MGHTVRDKQKLLNRVRRIRGQIDAIERTLLEEGDCISVLQQISSSRGAMSGLFTVVFEDHIRTHLVGAEPNHEEQGDAKEQLIDIIHSYLK
jgi:DNA-binding FrmR family transcriptional regulator